MKSKCDKTQKEMMNHIKADWLPKKKQIGFFCGDREVFLTKTVLSQAEKWRRRWHEKGRNQFVNEDGVGLSTVKIWFLKMIPKKMFLQILHLYYYYRYFH